MQNLGIVNILISLLTKGKTYAFYIKASRIPTSLNTESAIKFMVVVPLVGRVLGQGKIMNRACGVLDMTES